MISQPPPWVINLWNSSGILFSVQLQATTLKLQEMSYIARSFTALFACLCNAVMHVLFLHALSLWVLHACAHYHKMLIDMSIMWAPYDRHPPS